MTSSPKKPNPFSALQENASQLFDAIQNQHGSQMQCRDGCSKCCETEFGVFSGEAALIEEWFKNLDGLEKTTLQEKWRKAPEKSGVCGFLIDGSCTIYPARPVICRTQGAPLKTVIEKGKQSEVTLDACRLNFDEGKKLPKESKDWFDLDRLTELQVIAERFFSGNREGKRIALLEIKKGLQNL